MPNRRAKYRSSTLVGMNTITMLVSALVLSLGTCLRAPAYDDVIMLTCIEVRYYRDLTVGKSLTSERVAMDKNHLS